MSIRTAYIALGVIAILSLEFYVEVRSSWPGAADFLLNIAADLFVILLTVLLIDRILKRREEDERRRSRTVAVRQLYRPLHRHVTFLFNMYKASVKAKPEREISRVEDLVGGNYLDQIAHLDFGKPAPVHPPTDWASYASSEAQQLKGALNSTADKYASHLDSEILGVLEDLINSSFLNHVQYFPYQIETARKMGAHNFAYNFLLAPFHDQVDEHTAAFTKLVNIYNEVAPQDRQIAVVDTWGDHVSPQVGSARVPYKVRDKDGNVTLVE